MWSSRFIRRKVLKIVCKSINVNILNTTELSTENHSGGTFYDVYFTTIFLKSTLDLSLGPAAPAEWERAKDMILPGSSTATNTTHGMTNSTGKPIWAQP